MSKEIRAEHENFFPVDLHVHTPASHKCYKGPKTEEEYIEILKRYVEKGIKVIAITDHNTLQGYKKLISIKEKITNKLQVLSEYSGKNDFLQTEIENLQQVIKIFNGILILPGVEFEAYPGIHMLFIFDPSTNLEKIDEFLIQAGYSSDRQGHELPEECWCNLGIPEALEKVSNLGGLCIAAHADSDKGLYEILDGNYRAQAFTSDNLIAIQYSNPKNLERIKSLFLNKPYNNRTTPIAYIQCTDYHGEEGGRRVGSCVTFLKLIDISFNSVNDALRNPDTCVSPMIRPEDDEIINKLANEPYTLLLENLDGKNLDLFLKAICAQINSHKGSILLGITPRHKSIVGIKMNNKDVLDFIHATASEKIYPSIRGCYIDLKDYACGSERIVYALKFRKNTRDIYILKDLNEAYVITQNGVKVATHYDIANVVERRLFARMERQQEQNEKKITSLLKDFKLLGDNMRQFLLMSRIEKISTPLFQLMNITMIDEFEGEIDKEQFPINGYVDGNIIYVTDFSPRLEGAYLRCSAPRYRGELASCKCNYFSGPGILISPGGGSFYIDIEGEWTVLYKSNNDLAFVLQFQDFVPDGSYMAVLGWLKSSLSMWYAYCSQGDVNLSNIQILAEMQIPKCKCLDSGEKVEEVIKQILKYENEFLKISESYNQVCMDEKNDSNEKFICRIDSHNNQISKLAKIIDDILMDEFNLSDEEELMLRDFFDIKGIYNLFTVNEEFKEEFEGEYLCEVAATSDESVYEN